ncbi:uncharacterized protein [Drosophila takahashii]|uniref:uncharacterized protein n=1 Tax=Drosophila takahashii TaxID=29030 RepID=UPI001CF8D5B3|nr:uncharacterized protein LOC108065197 [Drosophila takahashii]
MASNLNPLAVSASNTEVTQQISKSISEGITNLILWRNWRKSMLIFVALQSLVYDLSSGSTISVVNLWAVTGLWITIIYRFYVRFLQWINKTDIPGNPYQKYLDMDISISPEQSKQLGVLFSNKIVWFLDNLRTILLAENLWKSFKVFIFLGGMALVVKMVNFTILFHVGFVMLFTIPKIYEMKPLLMKFPKFRKSKDQVKSTELTITSKTQVKLDTNISKKPVKDFCQIVLTPKIRETSLESDETQESCVADDDLQMSSLKQSDKDCAKIFLEPSFDTDKSQESLVGDDDLKMSLLKQSDKELNKISAKVTEGAFDSDIIQEPCVTDNDLTDMKLSKQTDKELKNIIVKDAEGNKFDSDKTVESSVVYDDLTIMKSSKQSDKEFYKIFLKPEDAEHSLESNITQDDLKILKTEEEAYDEFERLADWDDEDTLIDPTNQ